MIKVSDYVFKKLQEYGVRHVFLVTGGGAMHLNDSLNKNDGIEYVCNHHEQAAAIAAEGYFRACGKMAVVSVTSGPGGLNTLTGVMGQWTDSIPALYISGQVKYETTIDSCRSLGLRQLGDQEINIIDIVKPITKFSVMVKDPLKIRYFIEKAIFLANADRPGPVWLDIPLDIQASMIDEKGLEPYDGTTESSTIDSNMLMTQVELVNEKLKKAKCPVFYIGNGIRLANANNVFFKILQKFQIPVLTAINGHDLIWSDHPLFFGRPGICGDRLGNIMVQNCDLLVVIGTRLGVRQISYNFKNFAANAFKIMIDIDNAELNKPTLNIDLKIHADIKLFLDLLWEKVENQKIIEKRNWIKWGRNVEKFLPTIIHDNIVKKEYVNSYIFADILFQELPKDSIIVTGNGTAYTSTFQIMKIKRGMRVIANQGCASMGYDLPAAIGASLANNRKPVYLITGDGSIMMNLQELQTIVTYKLPVKIFILNNNGYLAIRTTQASFFNKNFIGESPASGVCLPDFRKVGTAFGIRYFQLSNNSLIKTKIETIINFNGPVICNLIMDPEQTLYPKVASSTDKNGKITSRPLEDMFPFLPENDLLKCYFKASTNINN